MIKEGPIVCTTTDWQRTAEARGKQIQRLNEYLESEVHKVSKATGLTLDYLYELSRVKEDTMSRSEVIAWMEELYQALVGHPVPDE